MSVIVQKNIALPKICEREVLRYAGVRGDDGSPTLFSECIAEAADIFEPMVCYTELSLKIVGELCDFGGFSVKSKSLAKALFGCEKVLVFAATVGMPFDRLSAKYIRLSPAKALLLSSLGTERIEAVCDAFVSEYSKKNGVKLTMRFSPGYGDLPLDVQKEVFAVLDPYKNIGVALGGSLLMTPTKSVTAFVGIV